MSTPPCRPALALGALALLLPASGAVAAPGRTFIQKPEVAAAQVRGAAAAPEAPAVDRAVMDAGPAPSWIWGEDPNRRYLLRAEVPGGAKAAYLRATCDNRMTVALNGRTVAEGVDWQQPVERDVTKGLRDGANELVVEVINEGGTAGLALKLALVMPDGSTRYVVTDGTWTAAPGRNARQQVPAKVVAGPGGGPWGDVFARAAAAPPTLRDTFEVPPGFQVERLFTVPREQLGSWVSITFDPKGRLIASDERDKGLSRVTPPPIGSDEPTKVEQLDAKITAAQGLLAAFDSLYVSVNGGPGSGLYRLRDTDNDDQYDEVTKLKALRGAGEHGPHALRLAPDGKSIFMASGNHTLPPENLDASRVPRPWGEDQILPRQWDARGHARGILAPGGWIAQTDPDGKTWEIFTSGYRNAYDFAFNAEGELFTYDSDMEWDLGMPWYRPTRAVHAPSGGEFGWRSGTGKWPPYYVDSLPAMRDIGPGSPVGVTFGYGAKFPAKFQEALFLLDWTFGTIYALHLTPAGATYRAEKEEFLSRTPLPLTDAAVGPDGALYFTIGGRGTQSELFRVTYVGEESTAPADHRDDRSVELRHLRRSLEKFHRKADDPAHAVAIVYPYLDHADRFIRYAARVALEHQDVALWQDRVLAERDPERLITGAVALARQGDKSLRPRLLEALNRLDFAALPEARKLELLRAWELVLIRMGPKPSDPAALTLAEPDPGDAARLIRKLDPFYPAASDALNHELVNLLVFLQSPTVVPKTIALMKQERPRDAEGSPELISRNLGYGGTIAKMIANRPDAQKIHYALALRYARNGWTPEARVFYFRFLQQAHAWSGGASYEGFLNNIGNDAFENASEADRLAVEAAGARAPFQVKELPKPEGPGHDWTLDEVLAEAQGGLTGRDFARGQRTFSAARCVLCHRFGGEGGATGPDLTQAAGRFGLKDMAEAIVEPSKVVSDQYRASVIATQSGQVYTGRIVNDSGGNLTILVDPEDSTKVVEVPRGEVEETKPSPVSLMPDGLLKALNRDEVLDLLAYLLSRGDPKDPMFKK